MKNNEVIEKMAVLGCRRNPQAHTVNECINCEFKHGMCDVYRVAKLIFENFVVLSQEEFDEDYVTKQDRDYWKNKTEILGNKLKQARNEKAKEFYQSFINELMRGCGDDKEFWAVKLINKKAKQFGVEVEE